GSTVGRGEVVHVRAGGAGSSEWSVAWVGAGEVVSEVATAAVGSDAGGAGSSPPHAASAGLDVRNRQQPSAPSRVRDGPGSASRHSRTAAPPRLVPGGRPSRPRPA